MSSSISIIGHAIVSADGMIATSAGAMPQSLIVEADQAEFQNSLNESALVVLGHKGHRNHPNPGRKRLVLTRAVAALQTDPDDGKSTYWNPAGLEFFQVLKTLGIFEGNIAITGGQGTFDLFLPIFTHFHLVEVHDVTLIDGIRCFSQGHPRDVLKAEGLLTDPSRELVAPKSVTKTIWRRPV